MEAQAPEYILAKLLPPLSNGGNPNDFVYTAGILVSVGAVRGNVRL